MILTPNTWHVFFVLETLLVLLCAGSSKSGFAYFLPSFDIAYFHGINVIQFKDEDKLVVILIERHTRNNVSIYYISYYYY